MPRSVRLAFLLALALFSASYSWALAPDDPGLPSQWGLNNTGQSVGGSSGVAGYDVSALSAWDTVNNASGVVVAVIDVGVDYNHPDLAGNMWHNTREIPFNGIDDDSNGIIDDYYGAAFTATSTSGDPIEISNDHGTMVAGVIGAVGNNTLGLTGMAWDVEIMALKVDGSSASVVSAIDYILSMKARGENVVAACASFGTPGGRATAVEDKIRSLGQAGTAWVASAGNGGLDNDASGAKEFPASYDISTILSVGAMTGTGGLASFSNYGLRAVDFLAPGVNINSTATNSAYSLGDGTSFSAPFAAGALALLAAEYPTDSVYARLSRLLSSVNQVTAMASRTATGGYMNASRALASNLALKPFLANATIQEGMVFGQSFSLSGLNFGAGNGSVSFGTLGANGPSAAVASWNATLVSGTVPASAGRYVMVADAQGNLSNALEFTAWKSVANMSQYHTDGGAAFWSDKLYVVGGRTSNSSSTASFEVYDPKTNTWGNLTDMPTSRAWCSAVGVGGKILVFGGVNLASNTFMANMESYDIESKTWKDLGIGLPYLNATAAVAVGNRVLVIGGMDATGTATKAVYAVDPTSLALNHVADLGLARYGHQAVAIGDTVLVFGGWTSPGNQASTMESIDAGNNVAGNSTALRLFMNGAVTDGSNVYMSTGLEPYNSTYVAMEPLFYSYWPCNASWSNASGTTMPPAAPRASAAMAFVPGWGVFAAGGFTGSGGVETQLKSVDFLAMADGVQVNSSLSTNGSTVRVTSYEVLQRTSEQLSSDYVGVPSGVQKFSDAREFTATIDPAGGLATFNYAVTASSVTNPGSLSLFKFDDVNNNSREFSYGPGASDVQDGYWWMTDANGTYVPSSQVLSGNETYYVFFAIKDNGHFDLNPSGGAIRDPQAVLGNVTRAGGGGDHKGGCLLEPEAGRSWEWLLVLAALPILWLRSRKRNA